MSVPASSSVDLVAPDAVRDPHAAFDELRRLGSIVWLERHKAWIVLDYGLVREALSDERLSTDTITPLYERLSPAERERYAAAESLLRGWMIFNDEPVHGQLRDPVRTAFTPRAVAALTDEIADLTDRTLAGLSPSFEFVREIGFPLPAAVIGMLLGIDDDRIDDLGNWSKQLGALVMGKVSRADAWDRALMAAEEMQTYFAELVERYRHHPADNLITRLVAASEQPGDGRLTPEQVVGACSLLLFGGHETTTSLLTTGARHALDHDDLRAAAVGTDEQVAGFVEEMLRFDGPSKIVVRRVRNDCDWNGTSMRAGQPVFLALAAANRDPAVFDRPEVADPARSPNRHLGFGWARHFCLGAQLAKLEAQVIVPRVLKAFPTLRLDADPGELAWHATVVGRTLRSLPVTSEPVDRDSAS